ncbi:hypothetical protein SDC9_117514 [bioreactor metagenome]|uniref:Cytoplasmic protein n=1 Tax=bioreactor metagenome TaxID=1076179 RepID=A0A645BYY3_9ZZZZ
MRTIQEASKHSIYNKKKVEKSSICGCYHCLNIFKPEEINSWMDEGRTAKCPQCDMDSVLGDLSGYEINYQTLQVLNEYWFEVE